MCLGAACSLAACNAGVIPPLSAAARRGDLTAMRGLLDAGADPNAAGDGGTRWPPLMHAVHTRRIEAARLLLARGADPDRSPNGYTALMMAAADADPAMLTLLLDHGADAQAQGPGGMTALTVAISGGALTDLHRPLACGCHPATLDALLQRVPGLRLPSNGAGREARIWAEIHARVQQLRNIARVLSDGRAPITTCHTPLVETDRR
jgi:ankyrin repeat protein